MFNNLNTYPDFLTSDDLVDLGLYASRNSIYFARIKGKGPDFIKFGKRILYPKDSVLEFIQSHLKKGNIPNYSKKIT